MFQRHEPKLQTAKNADVFMTWCRKCDDIVHKSYCLSMNSTGLTRQYDVAEILTTLLTNHAYVHIHNNSTDLTRQPSTANNQHR
jgi:hypothetical protein